MNDGHAAMLWEYLLGTLPAEEARVLEARLPAEPELGRELGVLRELSAALPLSLAETALPPPNVRERLLARASGPDRFLPFLDRLADLFRIDEAGARDALDGVVAPEGWLPFLPGLSFLPVTAGPALAGAQTGVVRLAPQAGFPEHTHQGEERSLILQGRCCETGGPALGPGDRLEKGKGSTHRIEHLGDEDLLFAVVARGVEIDGVRY